MRVVVFTCFLALFLPVDVLQGLVVVLLIILADQTTEIFRYFPSDYILLQVCLFLFL